MAKTPTANPQNGWIRLFYHFQDWRWYGDPNMVALFVHLLLTANYKTIRRQGETLKKGVVYTSRRQLAAETGMSERAVRTCLDRLEEGREIEIRATQHGSAVTIRNFASYQGGAKPSDPRATHQRPTKIQKNDPRNDPREITSTATAAGSYKAQPEGSDPHNDPRPTHQNSEKRPTKTAPHIEEVKKNIFVVANARAREEFLAGVFSPENAAAIEAFCKTNATTPEAMKRVASEVLDDWQLTAQEHISENDARRHMLSQIRIKLSIERRQKAEAARPAPTTAGRNRVAEVAPRNVSNFWADIEIPTE